MSHHEKSQITKMPSIHRIWIFNLLTVFILVANDLHSTPAQSVTVTVRYDGDPSTPVIHQIAITEFISDMWQTANLTHDLLSLNISATGDLVLTNSAIDLRAIDDIVINVTGSIDINATTITIKSNQSDVKLTATDDITFSGAGELSADNGMIVLTTSGGARIDLDQVQVNARQATLDTGAAAGGSINVSTTGGISVGTSDIAIINNGNISITPVGSGTSGSTTTNPGGSISIGPGITSITSGGITLTGKAANSGNDNGIGGTLTITTAAVTTILQAGAVTIDSDGDQLDDGWESIFFDDLDQDADADFDGDGFSNMQEFKRGLHPKQYAIELKKGWNLIAVSRIPKTGSILSALAPHIRGRPWCWDNGGFEIVETILPLRGHWVYSMDNVSVEISLD